jgi:hypothetical protein
VGKDVAAASAPRRVLGAAPARRVSACASSRWGRDVRGSRCACEATHGEQSCHLSRRLCLYGRQRIRVRVQFSQPRDGGGRCDSGLPPPARKGRSSLPSTEVWRLRRTGSEVTVTTAQGVKVALFRGRHTRSTAPVVDP